MIEKQWEIISNLNFDNLPALIEQAASTNGTWTCSDPMAYEEMADLAEFINRYGKKNSWSDPLYVGRYEPAPIDDPHEYVKMLMFSMPPIKHEYEGCMISGILEWDSFETTVQIALVQCLLMPGLGEYPKFQQIEIIRTANPENVDKSIWERARVGIIKIGGY